MSARARAIVLAALFLLAAALAFAPRRPLADAAGPAARPAAEQVFELAPFLSGLEEPVHLTCPPGDPSRLFLCEKGGRVRVVEGGKVREAPFLDVSSRVSRGSEQGLLSLAFHPEYAKNGRFFVSFTDRRGDTRVVERRVSPEDPDRADASFEREILYVAQPYSNHNGGLILFGPDGKLYIGLGDGGSGGDPHGNGQNLACLLGKLLRIDVDAAPAPGKAYAIPPDNPFADGRGRARPEIWAYGLRNPWRYSFDRATGDLYIADVGQNLWEEVDVAPAARRGGENYGWNVMEGLHPFRRPRGGGPAPALVAPVVEYGHDAGCSITGGFVYRGEAIPALRGVYFYADYCSGMIRSFRYEKGEVKDALDWTALVNPRRNSQWSSFGEDAKGELYLLSLGGDVYRFAPLAR